MASGEIFLILLRSVSDVRVSWLTRFVSGTDLPSWENNEKKWTITRNTTSNRFCLKKYNFNTIFVQFLCDVRMSGAKLIKKT
jgi:hypothetical protein